METLEPIQAPAARELTLPLRAHLQDLLARHGVPDELGPPVAEATPGQPHVVGAAAPSFLAGAGGLSGMLTASVLQYVIGVVVRLIQSEVVPPLMAALAEVKKQHPDFDPALILGPINRLLAYLGVPALAFSSR